VPANLIFDKSGKLIYGEGNREFPSKKIDLFVKKPRKHCPSMDRKQFFNQQWLFAHLAAPAGTFGDAGFIRGGPDRKEP
jgi:hypothetical protein